MRFRHTWKIVLALVIVSLVLLVISPFDLVIDKIRKENLLLIGLLISIAELLFISGIIIMATSVGHDIGFNPLKWRGHLKQIVNKVSKDKLFWVGFWINFAGAVMTTSVLTIMAIRLLPPQSWGVVLLGFLDIFITLSLRYEVIQLSKLSEK